MKELFRDPDPTRINYMKSILDAEGIDNHVRNASVAESGLAPIPIPETYPALCVEDEADYSWAMSVIMTRMKEDEAGVEDEKECPNCGEPNPGNFAACWNCEKSF